MIVGVIVLKLAEQPTSALFAWKGLIQRAILISFLGWVFTVAAMLRRACFSVLGRSIDGHLGAAPQRSPAGDHQANPPTSGRMQS